MKAVIGTPFHRPCVERSQTQILKLFSCFFLANEIGRKAYFGICKLNDNILDNSPLKPQTNSPYMESEFNDIIRDIVKVE